MNAWLRLASQEQYIFHTYDILVKKSNYISYMPAVCKFSSKFCKPPFCRNFGITVSRIFWLYYQRLCTKKCDDEGRGMGKNCTNLLDDIYRRPVTAKKVNIFKECLLWFSLHEAKWFAHNPFLLLWEPKRQSEKGSQVSNLCWKFEIWSSCDKSVKILSNQITTPTKATATTTTKATTTSTTTTHSNLFCKILPKILIMSFGNSGKLRAYFNLYPKPNIILHNPVRFFSC